MRNKWLSILLSLVLWITDSSSHAQARVVQLVAENPSTFVSADPNDPKYIVSIFPDGAKAVAVLPDIPSLRSTIMTDAQGQQYNCSIPSSPSTWSTAVTQQQATAAPAVLKTPFELIESLDGLCFYRQDGLWTYEVCHRKHVRQFSQVSLSSSISTTTVSSGSATVIKVTAQSDLDMIFDAINNGEDLAKLVGDLLTADDSSSKGEDFICGKYNGDEQQVEAILEDTSSSGHPLKYISHTFSGGGKCVLTGAPRTAEVRYTCLRETKENVVVSVREFPTCNYVVVISTPFLCKHAAFMPPAEDLRLVACKPLGNDDGTSESDAAGLPMKQKVVAAASSKEQAKEGKLGSRLETPSSKEDAENKNPNRRSEVPLTVKEQLESESIDDGYQDVQDYLYDDDTYGESAGKHPPGSMQGDADADQHVEL